MRISIDEISLALITTSYKRAQQLAIKEFFEYLQKEWRFEVDLDVLFSSFTEKMNLLKRLKDEFNKGGCESHQNCFCMK